MSNSFGWLGGLMSKLRLDWRTAEKRAIRDGVGEGLREIASDEGVVVLSGDLAESTRVAEFGESYPTRFVETGVAEQNMMGVAAGMASVRYVPYVVSYAVFSPGRNWEQLRTSVALSGLNVKIVGSHGGVSAGKNGPTHQGLEDIALTRVLPNMTVLVPADAAQTAAAIVAAREVEGPVYIRTARPGTWQLTEKGEVFEVGKIYRYREGSDVTIAACGVMVGQAMLVADKLAEKGVEAEVLNVSSVKPLDVETLVLSAEKTKRVVTMEDHQVQGGMGSAVAEVLSQESPVQVVRLGVEDKFGVSGEWEGVYAEMGLDVGSLLRRVIEVVD